MRTEYHKTQKTILERISLFKAVLFLLLFFISLEFYGKLTYYIFFAFLLVVLFNGKRTNITASAVCLFVLAVSIMIFDNTIDGVKDVLRAFAFPMSYMIGYGSVNTGGDLDAYTKRTHRSIYVLTFGLFFHFLINCIINLDSSNRIVIDVWTDQSRAATAQAALACMCIGLIAAFLFSKTSWFLKLFSITLLAVVIAYNLVLGGRAIFALVVVVFLLAFSYRNKKNLSGIIKCFFLFCIVVAIFIAMFYLNLFNIKTTIQSTAFYDRFFGSDSMSLVSDSRFELKLGFIENMIDYPWGGYNLLEIVGLHAHDIYLDTYDQAGIIAFLSLIAFMIASWIRLCKVLRCKDFPFETKLLILCEYIVLNLQFCLEPILQGIPILFISYCIIDGSVNALLRKSKRIRR